MVGSSLHHFSVSRCLLTLDDIVPSPLHLSRIPLLTDQIDRKRTSKTPHSGSKTDGDMSPAHIAGEEAKCETALQTNLLQIDRK